MTEQTDREAILREIAKKKTVYRIPGMEALPVRRDLRYTGAGGGQMPFDLYSPAERGCPLVVIPFGYADPGGRVRAFGPVTSWAQLLATSGIAAVLYGASQPAEDVDAMLAHLRANAPELNFDATRIGLFATSGNVPVALSALMRDPSLRCAALLYGYTMDLDGSTAVAAVARQFMFADACAGKSVDDLPDAVPMLFLRAGREQFPGLNEALDKVVSRAISRNLPVTLVNHATGAHGFDLDEDNDLSREMIRRVLSFLAFHLK